MRERYRAIASSAREEIVPLSSLLARIFDTRARVNRDCQLSTRESSPLCSRRCLRDLLPASPFPRAAFHSLAIVVVGAMMPDPFSYPRRKESRSRDNSARARAIVGPSSRLIPPPASLLPSPSAVQLPQSRCPIYFHVVSSRLRARDTRGLKRHRDCEAKRVSVYTRFPFLVILENDRSRLATAEADRECRPIRFLSSSGRGERMREVKSPSGR